MRNVLNKCRENQNTHFTSNSFFFRKSCRLWDNVAKYGWVRGDTNDVTIWRIRFACWISKATCTQAHAHSHAPWYTHARARTHTWKYVIIINFPQQQWLRTHLNGTLYVRCLSCYMSCLWNTLLEHVTATCQQICKTTFRTRIYQS
jgi:hypothetical protein